MDPYLSNSVQELDAPDLARLRPIPILPQQISDADWVLLTHHHIDHCDPHTIPALSKASPHARFMGPPPVIALLQEWGLDPARLHHASEAWSLLSANLRVHAVPAAHPVLERDKYGQSLCVGFVLEYLGTRMYIAGDTGLTTDIIDALCKLTPLSVAMLPVNEQNYYRDKRGIIGNMSIREAFQLAMELEIDSIIPVHWDMFDANSVDPEEIEAVYRSMEPAFRLLMHPDRILLEPPCT